MSEIYQFVVSILGDPSYQSSAYWESDKIAEEEGNKWAEQQPWLKDKEYTVRPQLKLVGD